MKTIILITALAITLAGCAMNEALEQKSLEGLTAKNGESRSIFYTGDNVSIKTPSYYNTSFYLITYIGGGTSGPIQTVISMSTTRLTWTLKRYSDGTYNIGNLSVRSGGGVSGPIVNLLEINSSSPTRWTITRLSNGNFTIRSGNLYLSANVGGGASGPIGAFPSITTTPYQWIISK